MRAKLISEAIRFERGLSPKDAMNVGDKDYRITQKAIKFLQPVIDVLKELKKQDSKIKNIKFHQHRFNGEIFQSLDEFYIEFTYNRRSQHPSYCSIGLENDNIVVIFLNDSKEQINDKILTWIDRC